MNRDISTGSVILINPLVQRINKESRDIGLRDLIFPLDTLVTTDARNRDYKARKISTALGQMRPVMLEKEKSLNQEIRALTERKQRIAKKKANALDIEKPLFVRTLRQLNSEIAMRRREINKSTELLESKRRSAERLQRSYETRVKILNQILTAYPTAHLVDLSCLVHFKNEQGLPALALFNTSSAETSISLYFDDVKISASELRMPKAIQEQLSQSISKACGARIRNWSREITPDCSATSIELKTNFTDCNGVIPNRSRKIIRQAIKSKLFDEVLLISEVRKWRIKYTDLIGEPLLSGSRTSNPITNDPLVIGIKKIAGQNIALLLHAFDTTSLEREVKHRYTSKVK